MLVKSKEIRTIKIDGVEFTPAISGVKVPSEKIKSLKENFFFKHYVRTSSFTVTEEPTEPTEPNTETEEVTAGKGLTAGKGK